MNGSLILLRMHAAATVISLILILSYVQSKIKDLKVNFQRTKPVRNQAQIITQHTVKLLTSLRTVEIYVSTPADLALFIFGNSLNSFFAQQTQHAQT